MKILCVSAVLGVLVAGCAASSNLGGSKGDGSSGGSAGTENTASGGSDTGTGGTGIDVIGAGGDDQVGPLEIAPADPVVDVVVEDGAVITQSVGGVEGPLAFSATAGGQDAIVNWAIDRGEIGAIDKSGNFTAKGVTPGIANITAQTGTLTGTTTVTVRIKATQNGIPDGETDKPTKGGIGGVGGEGRGGPVDDAMMKRLTDETPKTADFTWLYPYDNTVWPRGIQAPLLQWRIDKEPTAVYIHITQKNYEFEGFYSKPDAATTFMRHPIEYAAWKAALNGNDGDDMKVEIKLADADGVYGPYDRTWLVAPGQLKGTVYYSSYNTQLTTPIAGLPNSAAILQIKAGANEPTLAIPSADGRCINCHTVSDDGSTLFAQEGFSDDDPRVYDLGASYDLRNNGALIQTYDGNAADSSPNARKFANSGVWLDGSFAMRSANDKWCYVGGDDYFAAGAPIYDVGLFRRDNGSSIPMNGMDNITKVVTPVFSPDGTKLIFNYWEGTAGDGGGDGHTLDVMDVECKTVSKPGEGPSCSEVTFSNLRRVYTHPDSQGNYAGWPAWMPDSQGVAFQHKVYTPAAYFESYLTTFRAGQADIWYVPIPDKASSEPQAVELFNLNGNGYLPKNPAVAGHDNDENMNYEPTSNPIASGGYYWVVFTSRRMYGNVADGDPYDLGDGTKPISKKLWVAAIDQNPEPGKDPSHPAFYLPGQELNAPNTRGFWVVDPCKENGKGCETGDECCGGFCRPNADNKLVCSNPPMDCSKEYEKCETDADCCENIASGGDFRCVNEHCARRPVVR